MSTARVFTSSLRAVVGRRAAASAPAQRQSVLRSATRRGIFSGGSSSGPPPPGSLGAELSSDLPWFIASVVVTAPALAWLMTRGPKKAIAHTPGGAPGGAPVLVEAVVVEEKDPAVESNQDSDTSSTPASTPPESETGSDTNSDSDSNESPPPTNQLPEEGGNPQAAHTSSQTGGQVPPPSADNSDMATNYGEKKEAQGGYKEMIRHKDTRAASSSSDLPSKKGAAEHPREDPQKGEGEAVQKGGPAA
ncbi:hypothetical protein F5Y00DRAFT_236591 [Daldinia vernicosa]|uniref:uncharacterized protein n=1 Tax=Daldinia vernicosa TaxID=114800 RepID=UPI0020089242|nr:uncharacterized protein F5Y00DRAFT_236591 [Daldinia vernicosa]KAI0849097.1 hypothetical protein F5Y00DRAFT_236591 [Daldinia vernicosa]